MFVTHWSVDWWNESSAVSLWFWRVCVRVFLQAYMQNVFQLCLTIVPMMFSLSVFNVITDTMLTKSVPSTDTGDELYHLKVCESCESPRQCDVKWESIRAKWTFKLKCSRLFNLLCSRVQARWWDCVHPSSLCSAQLDRLSAASCTWTTAFPL